MSKKYYQVLIIGMLAFFIVNFFINTRSKEKNHTNSKKPINIERVTTDFNTFLNANLKESGTIGAAVVVTYKGKIALLKCFGHRKIGEKETINKNTVFRLASVSKSVTGILAGILQSEGIVNLDDKVIDYLPEFSLKEPKNARMMTVRNLLSHTSGLVPHAFDLMAEDHVPLLKIIQRFDEVSITAPPGKLYGYQNVLFSMYAPIAAIKTNETFEQLLAKKVFKPFGMTNASASFKAFKENKNKAYPHHKQGRNTYLATPLNDKYYNTLAAAGVNASISDLGKMLIALNDSTLISTNALKATLSPQIKTPLRRSYFQNWGDGIKSREYAIGWRIINYKDRTIAYHGGYLKGYKAEIAFCAEEEIGIAILSNSPNREMGKNIPKFLNLLFIERDKIETVKNELH